jgi:REP element-mobilizing transposase RayT
MLKDVRSGCFKKPMHDTRNNWVTMEFNTKYRYNCFRKQSHIDTCIDGFRELERIGFEFGPFGFAGNHVHFPVNIPKRYSVQDAQIMLKSRSARKMFEHHPGFRKRYPRGGFWSGYEHHESTGLIDLDKSSAYCRSQQQHHGVTVIDDRQQRLPN